MQRRQFLATTAACALAPSIQGLGALAAGPVRPRIRAFAPSQVRLRPGPALDAAEVNRRFVLGQDVDRLLHNFRQNAGLPSSAAPLGGWEAPNNELRGHYVGHYLSACALVWASFGDAQAKQRGDKVVSVLAECQRIRGNGYLSAFPEEFFDRLRENRQVWAPFYTLHKIMVGMLDMHTLAGNAQALDVLKGMARWTARWTQPLGDADMARVLEREYGGMNDVLYALGALTGEAEWRGVAHRFDHERIFRPQPTKPRTIPEYKADGLPTPSLTGQAPWLRGEDGKPLTFRTTAGERRELVPLYQIMDERYSVYFKVT